MEVHKIPVAGFRIKRPNKVSVGDLIYLDGRLLVISYVDTPFHSQGCTKCPLNPKDGPFCSYRDDDNYPPCLLSVDGYRDHEFVILKEVNMEDI